MNINKTVLCSLLVGLSANAMQQQQQVQKPQEQQQHQHNQQPTAPDDNNNDAVLDAAQIELAAQLQALLDNANKTHGSVDNMAKQKTREHKRVCPNCNQLSTNCYADQERIRCGEILPCGCSDCHNKSKQY